ncbi:MAG: hypothetical protein GX154_05985 [Clostridiales bacterium]|nr:hypothetical protein [Clostridiales bacterium]
METLRRSVIQWNTLLPYVKGHKSHQFTTNSLGANIYFDSSGKPRYVADDTPFTDMENFMMDTWYHEYHYNKTETSPLVAIDNYRNGLGSICIETFTNGFKTGCRWVCLWSPYVGDTDKFTLAQLISDKSWIPVIPNEETSLSRDRKFRISRIKSA